MEQIGVKAVFDDQDFHRKIAEYNDALLKLQQTNERMAQAKFQMGQGDTSGYKEFIQLQLDQQEAQRQLAALLPGYTMARQQATDADRQAAKQARILAAEQRALEQQQRELEQAIQKTGIALSAAGAAAGLLARQFLMVAARNAELAIVVNQVGANIGKTTDEMEGYEAGIKDMGITTQASRQAIIQMVQANIDLENSARLARLAQDAAVIGQMNSSEAFERLVTVVQRGSVVMARQMGLNVSFQGAYKKLAQEIGKTSNDLTEQEKVAARLNAIFEAGTNIAGSYEAAMGSAAKQQRSMARYTEELADQMGQALLPIYSEFVGVQTDLLKSFLDLPQPIKDTASQLLALSAAAATSIGGLMLAIPKIQGVVAALSKVVTSISGLSLGGMGLALAPPAALIAAILYTENLEKAHRAEAAALLETASTYDAYLFRMDRAQLATETLSRELWDLAQAQMAVNDAASVAAQVQEFQAWTQEVSKLTKMYQTLQEQSPENMVERLGDFDKAIKGMSDLGLQALATTDTFYEQAIQFGLTEEQARYLDDMLQQLAQTEILLRREADDMARWAAHWQQVRIFPDQRETDGLRSATEALRDAKSAFADLAAETGLTTDKIFELVTVFGMSESEVKAYAENIDFTGATYRNLMEQTGLTVYEIQRLHEEMGMGVKEILAWADAQDKAAKETARVAEAAAKEQERIQEAALRQMEANERSYATALGTFRNQIVTAEQRLADQRLKAHEDFVDQALDLEERLAEQRQDIATDLAKRLADVDADLAERKVDLATDLARDLSRIDYSHYDRVAKAANEHYKTLDDLAKEHQRNLLDLERDYQDERADIISKYSFTPEESFDDRRSDLMDRIRELEKELAETTAPRPGMRAMPDWRKEKELKELREQLDALQQEELTALDERKQAETEALAEWLAEQQAVEDEAYQKSIEAEQAAWEVERSQREAQYGQDLIDLQTQHGKQREEIQRAADERLADINAQGVEELAAIESTYGQRLESLTAQQVTERNSFLAAYANELYDLQTYLASREQEWRDHQTAVEGLLGIHSPSRWMGDLATQMLEGFDDAWKPPDLAGSMKPQLDALQSSLLSMNQAVPNIAAQIPAAAGAQSYVSGDTVHNHNLSIQANYAKVQRETSLRQDLMNYDAMLRARMN